MPSANIAGVRLLLEGGIDLADKIDPRLSELTLSEKREGEADELTIRLQNADGALAIPADGRMLTLALGWVQGDSVPVGLVGKGQFTVDEAGAEGPPDEIMITARSADLTGLYAQRRTKAWHDTTLGAVLGEIASRHGRTLRIAPELESRAIASIEQEGKSDMAFVRDLGRRYDALATWKGGALLFLPIGASATASGERLPTVTLTRQDGARWRYSRTKREARQGAEAQWHDAASGRRRTVSLGEEPRRKLRRIYASEAEARQAAEAAMSRDARTGHTFSYDLAVADCAIQTDQPVRLSGWDEVIDSVSWLVKSVSTTYGPGGLSQSLELEGA